MRNNRGIREHIISVCALFLVAIILLACGGSTPVAPAIEVESSREVIVNSTVFAASSKQAYDAMIEALADNDAPEVKKMVIAGDAFIIEPGERATVLDQGRFWYKVRFTSGQHSGRLGWFGMEFAN